MEEVGWSGDEPRRASNPVTAALNFVAEITLLFLSSARTLLAGALELRETLHQMAFIGVASVPIVALTAVFSGAVLALYSASLLVRFGVGSLSGGAVGLAVTREIAPVLTAMMVAARCGSAIAAQIASMKVTEQIDALRALAVSPIAYLVVPRVVAALLMLPLLCTVANFAGVGGGALLAFWLGVPFYAYFRSLQMVVGPFDFTGGLIKVLAFALIIVLVSCQQGLAARGGAAGVGRATTNAVVISMVLIYIANYFLADALFSPR